MSISGSLSNALSGLTAASRAAEVVSSNVANALTEGYGRRELELAARSVGGNGAGVRVVGVLRNVDEQLVTERRLAESRLGQASVVAEFHKDMEQILGLPDDPGSLGGWTTQLETALIEAASRPDSEPRLDTVLRAAQGLSSKLNGASERVQELRLEADGRIAEQVRRLNENLSRVAELNHAIRVQLAAGRDANALMDQRQQTIDSISEIVPLRQVPRGNGQVALFTPGGVILLDGTPARIGFAPVGTIVPQMSLGSGALSGLTVNGNPVATGSSGPLGGGSLGALFDVRDNLAVTAQTRLDAMARNLIERLADPAVDPTLTPGDAGLFTDAGVAFSAANETGISARISVNPLVDPAGGGALWRLRDGLGATSPGDVGNATLLSAMGDALRAPRIPSSGGFIGAARSAPGLASDILSLNHADLLAADADKGFAIAQFDAMKTLELQDGVDTDRELQQLLLIEQSYSANARIISTVDDLIQTLLRL